MSNFKLIKRKFHKGVQVVAKVTIGKRVVTALVDTGATCNIIDKKFKMERLSHVSELVGFTGSIDEVPTIKEVTTEYGLMSNILEMDLKHLKVDIVLGANFFLDNKIILDFSKI